MIMKKAKTKMNLVYENLKREIIEGKLKPEERLIIAHISERFNVSSIPVREAFQILASEGFIEILPHAGAIVKTMSLKDIKEIFEIRFNLEVLAAQLAVANMSNSNLSDLEEIIEKSKQAFDPLTYDRSNREFHQFIYSFANNQRLYNIIDELWNNSSRYPRVFQSDEDLSLSISEHTGILEALKARDVLLVKELMEKHKTRGFEKIYELVSKK